MSFRGDDKGLADRVFERPGRDRRHFGDQSMGRNLALFGIIDVDAVVIEGGQRADSAGHDGHRVGVGSEPAKEPIELRVQHGVVSDRALEIGERRCVGQFAVQEQITNLKEGRMLRQLFDGVAAVQQNAGVAIDEGDLALATRRGRKAGIEGENVRVGVELSYIDDVRARGPLQNRQVEILVPKRERGLICHAPFPCPKRMNLADVRSAL